MTTSNVTINTSSFCEGDFSTFLDSSERIKNCEERQRREWLKKAILTNKEIFETSVVTDDHHLLKPNEGEQSFLSKSASMEELLKYFEEDVVTVDSDQDAKKSEKNEGGQVVEESTLRPSKVKVIQKRPPSSSGAVLNSFERTTNIKPSDIMAIRRQSSAPSGSYSLPKSEQLDPKRKFVKLSDMDLVDKTFNIKEKSPSPRKGDEVKRFDEKDLNEYGFKSKTVSSILNGKVSRPNHQHLKPSDLNLTLEEWEKRYFQIMQNNLKPQDLNLTQKEWDERYFQIINKDLKPVDQERPMSLEEKRSKWEKPSKPKKTVKSRVQKIAEMFNGMITQMMKNEHETYSYERFSNELSPEPVKAAAVKSTPVQTNRVATPRPSPAPTPKPSPRLNKRPVKQSGCLVPENVFNKLSVKDKALLFNKFMKEMTLRNPDFSFDPEEYSSTIAKKEKSETPEVQVLTQKQETVMNMAREIESKFIFPKQTISEAALAKPPQKSPSKKGPAPQPPVQAPSIKKEEEQSEQVHVSKLTVVLKPSPDKVAKSVVRRKITPSTVVVCPSMKRSNSQILSSIPIEVYAPPRKIRRTRPERSNSRKYSQNPNIKELFYDWMKERHGISFDIKTQAETSPTQETIDDNPPNNIGELEDKDVTLETDTTLKNDEPEVEPEAKPEMPKEKTDHSESDSSLMTMPSTKPNTDESQTDQSKESPDGDFEFAKPVRPPRKKKKRTTLTWKKDVSIVEKLPVSSTTDSDSDSKQQALMQVQSMKPKKPTTLNTDAAAAKKLVFQDSPISSDQHSFDDDFVNFVNSPNKIRNAYTLTVMSSPSPKTESFSSNKSEAPAKPPRKEKPLAPQLPYEIDESKFENVDQGFETSSTGYSPARKPLSIFPMSPMKEKSPLFIKLNAEIERRLSGVKQTPSAYSTPVKQDLNSSGIKITPAGKKPSPWHTVFSPIKSNFTRRRSLNDSESRRSSIVMDVIREEQHQQQQSKKPESPDVDDEVFLPSSVSASKNSSSFWITINELTLSLEIQENPKDRLSLLGDIFSQKTGEYKKVHFGIDDLKYSPKEGAVNEKICENLSKIENVSHYWFASGDLAVPFQGNYIAPERVKEIFTFLRNSHTKDTKLMFGVDDIEFSRIPDPASLSPKFSIESSYSMLIGLNDNRSNKFNWPSNSRNSTPMKTSDFDPSEFDSDSFEVSEMGRLSFSPYGSNYFDMASMQSERSSSASFASTNSPEMFTFNYENEPLDKMFGKKKTTTTTNPAAPPTTVAGETFVFGKSDKTIQMPKPLPPADTLTVDKMIETIRRQKSKLENLETDMKTYSSPSEFTSSFLDKYHGRPYVKKLHNIVRSIQIIGRSGFENCSSQQLEGFLYFLSLYAETCLSSCSNQMNVILEQLSKDKGTPV